MLNATAISWHFLKLSKTIFNSILTPKLSLLQQDKALPDQSGKGKNLSQSRISMIFQFFFVRMYHRQENFLQLDNIPTWHFWFCSCSLANQYHRRIKQIKLYLSWISAQFRDICDVSKWKVKNVWNEDDDCRGIVGLTPQLWNALHTSGVTVAGIKKGFTSYLAFDSGMCPRDTHLNLD